MVCKNCGKKVRKGTLFCVNCGARVEADAPAAAQPESGPDGGITKKQKILIGALSAAALLMLCVVIAVPFIYKNAFRKDFAEFQKLEEVYALGEYESSYQDMIHDGQVVIDENAFFAIKEQKAQMRELEKALKEYNDKNVEQFQKSYEQFVKTGKDYKLGTYESEYKKKLEEAKAVKEDPEYKAVAAILPEMQALSSAVEEMNKKIAEYQTAYKDAKDAFEFLYVSAEKEGECQSLLDALKDAIDAYDTDACGKAAEELQELEKSVTEDNIALLSEKQEYYGDYDTWALYDVEQQIYQDAYEKANTFFKKGDYLNASKEYQVCGNIIDTVESSDNYYLSLEQVDVTDFPKIKLYVSAWDEMSEQYLTNLDEDNFSFMESTNNGSSYETVDVMKAIRMDGQENLNVAVVADCSASMEDYGLSYAKNVMCNFVDTLQTNVGDEAAVYSFADEVYREQYFTSDKSDLKNAINGISMGNMTALYDGLAFSLSEITVQSGAKCIIAFTDGMENYSYTSREYVISKALEYKVPIYLIGIGYSVDSSDLEYIAQQTGGFYVNIDDVYSMQDVYDRIYREQKSMYVIEYKTREKQASDVTRYIYLNYAGDGYGMRMADSYTPADYKINNFIFFDSDQRYLTEDELDELTEAEVRIALNEIYARRGYKFTTAPDMIMHFESCDWYNGTETDMNAVAATFNQYEQKNVDLLVNYECKHGLNGRVQ